MRVREAVNGKLVDAKSGLYVDGEGIDHSSLHANLFPLAFGLVPDERKGERLIVLHTPVESMNTHQLWEKLNDRGLPNLWLPGERDFIQIPEMPVLGTGKVDLKRAKEMALEHTRNGD